jgi:coproporphyrinogen III oxidase-like Fe-S oxidoreductase
MIVTKPKLCAEDVLDRLYLTKGFSMNDLKQMFHPHQEIEIQEALNQLIESDIVDENFSLGQPTYLRKIGGSKQR